MIRIAHFGGLAVLMLILALGAALSPGRPARADSTFVLPAGLACNFELSVVSVGGDQVNKEFKDKNGNLVRSLSAGKGAALTFTNNGTGATMSLKPNGAVTHTTYNPDGSQTVVITGHNVLILFPSDVPAGPSTTLYVGKVVFTIDPNGVFTLQAVSGKTTDICAALS